MAAPGAATAAETAGALNAAKDLPLVPDAPVLTPEDKLWAELQTQVTQIDKGVNTSEARFLARILRAFHALRKRLSGAVLAKAIVTYFPNDHARRQVLSRLPAPFVPTPPPPPPPPPPAPASTATAIETSTAPAAPATEPAKPAASAGPPAAISAEVDAYLSLLVFAFFVDQKQTEMAVEFGNALISHFFGLNQRALDPLLAKMFFLLARATDALQKSAELRSQLLDALRTTTLRRYEDCQATLLNELLRNLINHDLYEQADKLVAKVTLPKGVSNNQHARFLYYTGRIKAIQLDYSASHKDLTQAMRKSPHPPAAPGFQQAVHKLSVIVQLLIGDIPERSMFRIPVLRKTLQPYLRLTQAVRVGDLRLFEETVEKHAPKFRADKTYMLILRLRHNVIKTGVRMISVSYSRISLADVAAKLHLGSVEDAEYIAAKAIRDGVIEAVLDHRASHMSSKEIMDMYSTTEPQQAFHNRVTFSLDLYNEAVKALRFPSNAHKKQFESIEDRKEREREEKEFATEMANGGDDDDMI